MTRVMGSDFNKKSKSDNTDDRNSKHPSGDLGRRSQGFGIGGGYERPYTRDARKPANNTRYGPVPHSGYYGSAHNGLRFKLGQAGFRTELDLYKTQYGDKTITKKYL